MNEFKIVRNIPDSMELNDYLLSIHIPKKVINEMINNNVITKEGNKILFNLDEYDKNDIEPFDGDIDIVYEDSEILVIKKPRGILIHSDGETFDTLLNRVSFYQFKKGIKYKIRVIHRLDLETIGLVVFCKNLISYYHLNYQMEEGLIKKKYYAIVNGKLTSGRIKTYLARDRHDSKKYRVSKSGRLSETIYNLIDFKNDKSLLDIELITGRTHQIRVHMAYLNHSIIGDSLYGDGNNLMLENYLFGYFDPITNEYKEIKVENELEF